MRLAWLQSRVGLAMCMISVCVVICRVRSQIRGAQQLCWLHVTLCLRSPVFVAQVLTRHLLERHVGGVPDHGERRHGATSEKRI